MITAFVSPGVWRILRVEQIDLNYLGVFKPNPTVWLISFWSLELLVLIQILIVYVQAIYEAMLCAHLSISLKGISLHFLRTLQLCIHNVLFKGESIVLKINWYKSELVGQLKHLHIIICKFHLKDAQSS